MPRQDAVEPRGAASGSSPSSLWSRLASRSVRTFRFRADGPLALLDAVLVAAAYTAMLLVRYELAVPGGAWQSLLWSFLPIAVAVQVTLNALLGLYGPVWQHASIVEAQRILLAGLTGMLALLAVVAVGPRSAPLSVVVSGALLATALMGILRFQSRLFAFYRRQRADATRILVVGAGRSGSLLLREINDDPEHTSIAVALLDDDPRKIGRSIGATPILGPVDDLVEIARDIIVDQVILAIPTADSALVRRVADAVAELGVPLKVLPSVAELMSAEPQLRDVRDLSIDDLLGRQPVATDLAAVKELIYGRRVLVTGGGGSIGSEIARQVAEYGPSCLLVLDRDETHLFDAMAAIEDRGEPVLLDVRDRRRIRALFQAERPDIVFHAAANKHVPLLEQHPAEAVSTNVLGTDHVVRAARDAGVRHLVFVSTDKAVDPANVMGATKRLGEQLVLSAAPVGSAWCAVRFGNVLGSRGSVVPTFMRQIRAGGPVTVTDRDVTRYFMSIPEAVQLVLQAAALADDRQVFMLDMGEPVRIMDLAARMISLAGLRPGTDIEVVVTGLRPGEKLTEELHTAEEADEPTAHPKIRQVRTPVSAAVVVQRTVHQLADAVENDDMARIRQLLLPDERSPRTLSSGGPLTAPVPRHEGDQDRDPHSERHEDERDRRSA